MATHGGGLNVAPRVAFQGERGAYGDEAIALRWRGTAIAKPCWSFQEVIDAVLRGQCDYGILPVENSVVGRIAPVCDLLERASDLRQLDDVTVPVHHALLAPPGATLDTLTLIASHPVALAQCRAFLARHPKLAVRDSYDTAGAARDVAARGLVTEAAIAGISAGRRYHLEVLATNIQDISDNQTRFVIIGNATTRMADEFLTDGGAHIGAYAGVESGSES